MREVPDPDRLLDQGAALQAHGQELVETLRTALRQELDGPSRPAKIARLQKALADVERLLEAAGRGDAAMHEAVRVRMGKGPYRLKAFQDVLKLSSRPDPTS